MAVRDIPYHAKRIGGLSGHNNPGGQVWYVGASGYTAAGNGQTPSDSNKGTSPQQPFSTIQKGLDSAVAGRGDYVALLPGTYTITAVLTMTKADVTLGPAHPISLYAEPNAVITTATDSISLLDIDASNITVEGLKFTNTASTSDTFMVDVADGTSSTGVTIRNCYFEGAGGANTLNQIRLGDGTQTATLCLIEDCTLSGIDDIGITISAGSDENIIRNTIIRDTTGTEAALYAISNSGDNCMVEGCTINCNGTAGILNASGALRNVYRDNRIHAIGADTIRIQAAATTTMACLNNHITAVIKCYQHLTY